MTYRARSIIAAIGLAVVAAVFVGFYVSNYKRNVQHSQQHVTVYVASRDIPEGTAGSDLASKGYMRQSQVLRDSVVPGAISQPKEIERLVAAQTIFSGQQIALNSFSDVAVQGIRGVVKGNLRAVQISGTPDQTLAGTLRVGDHVDVVGNIKVGNNDSGRSVTRIVLRNLRVLKAPTGPTSSGISSANGGSPVMLAVTDTQVQKLFFVVRNDDWTLELRPVVKAVDDQETVATQKTLVEDGLGPAQLRLARGG